MLYAPTNASWVEPWLREVARDMDLDFERDFTPLPGCSTLPPDVFCFVNATDERCPPGVTTNCAPCALLADNKTMSDYIFARPNTTQNAILFLGAYLPPELNVRSYMLFYNITRTRRPFLLPDYVLEWKVALDRALLQLGGLKADEEPGLEEADAAAWAGAADAWAHLLQGRTSVPEGAPASTAAAAQGPPIFGAGARGSKGSTSNASFEVAWKTFPQPEPRVHGYDVVAENGGIYFYLPPMICFFVLLNEIVEEKENQLRQSMRRVGMRARAYWLAFLIQGVVVSAVTALLLLGSGIACGFDVFTNANFLVNFLLFFTFTLAMVCVAMFTSTLLSRTQTVGYTCVLVGFVFQTILSSAYGGLIDLMLQSDVPFWLKIVRWVLTCYPPFNMAKVFYDVSNLSSAVLDIKAGVIRQGAGFHWADLFTHRHVQLLGFHIDVPPTWHALMYIVADAGLFLLAALYLDRVLAGPHGTGEHPLFFLDPLRRFLGQDASEERGATAPDPARYVPLEGDGRGDEEAGRSGEGGSKPAPDSATAAVAPGGPLPGDGGEPEGPSEEEEGVAAERERTLQLDPEDADTALLVRGLGKVYPAGGFAWKGRGRSAGGGAVRAVEDVSFAVREGEVFCLLGHNGAGKTTTLNVLTGLIAASRGSAFVAGHRVGKSADAVHSLCGVCPQHDTLWPRLTAREHMAIFAELKGVPAGRVAKEVEEKLRSVDLWAVAAQAVGGFSGGMKRRLSLAIASIGDPRIVFLDEPTTGMDPVARREAWALIQALKRGRAVVLTTHNMQEADTLSDRLAIMAHGRLRALGTPLRLKNNFGGGYRVTLTTEAANVSWAVQQAESHVPGTRVLSRESGNVTVALPRGSNPFIPGLLAHLENQSASKLHDWSLSHTTLEDVFLRVTRGEGEEHRASMAEPGSSEAVDAAQCQTPASPVARLGQRSLWKRSFRALWRKSLTLLSRQYGQNLCQVLSPLLVLGILLLLQLVIRAELGGTTINTVPSLYLPLNLNLFQDHARVGDCAEFFLYADHSAGGAAGSLQPDGHGSGLLGGIPQRSCVLRTGYDVGQVPYWLPKPSGAAMDAHIYRTLTDLGTVPVEDLQREPDGTCPPASAKCPALLVPDGTAEFAEVDTAARRLSFTFSVDDSEITGYHRPNNFTRLALRELPGYIKRHHRFLVISPARAAMVDMLSAPFLSAAGVYTRPPGPLAPLATNVVASSPEKEVVDALAIVEVFAAFLFPVALTLQLPVFLYVVVLEKEMGLRQIQLVSGMRMGPYWAVATLLNLALYAALVLSFVVGGLSLQLRFFVQTHPSVQAALFLGWGLALVAFSTFLSSFLNSRRVATVMGYAVALFGTLTCLVISDGLYAGAQSHFSLGATLPTGCLALPLFGLVRAVFLMNDRCTAFLDCYGPLSDIPADDELLPVLASLYICAAAYFLAGLYMDSVLPSQFGVPRHPLFPLHTAWRAASGLFRSLRRRPGRSHRASGNEPTAAEPLVAPGGDDEYDSALGGEAASPDVVQEELAVDTAHWRHDALPALMCGLRKTYGSGASAKHAVRGLSLRILPGDCFGLLGENGAGKTTLMSMLTGIRRPSGGSAFVCGHPIRTEMQRVNLLTGFAPQHDVLWEDLTVLETVLYYARVRGVEPAEEQSAAESALREVALWSTRNRRAARLSGGMRQRLSLANALVGGSQLVILDEPTTGLDPVSRREVWDVLERVKRTQPIIVSTHLMDEAEALCTRIGIMVQGRLRAVGTQAYLKAQHGSGYQLHINHRPDMAAAADACVRKVWPQAERVTTFRGFRAYHNERATARLADLFQHLDENGEAEGITDFAVGEIDLDDVFARVLHKAHAKGGQETD